jgi:hypothetical protein
MPRGKKKKVIETFVEKPAEVDLPEGEIPESEADAMFERVEVKKTEERKKVEDKVDAQDWTRMDPDIPEALMGRVWVAVYRCEAGHKTKATNRQKDTGIWCHECKQKAEIMPKLFDNPPEDQSKKSDRKRKEMDKRGR